MKTGELIDMSRGDGTDYWRCRAEEELALARASTTPEAERFRYTLAGLYFDRHYGGELAAAR